MPESNDYKVLKKNLPTGNDRLDRVENFVVAGMPDINFCSEGKESWIEQKSPIEPKRQSTKLFGSNHKISQDQKNWFLRQMKAEGNAYFLIVTNNTCQTGCDTNLLHGQLLPAKKKKKS